MILTRGYEQNQVDSLKKIHKSIKTIPYNINEPLGKSIDSVGAFYILGEGLQPFDFWQLDKVPAQIVEGYKPLGITKLNYNSDVIVGDELAVKGSYSNGKKGNRLVLSNPRGAGIDSIVLSGLVEENFMLTMTPKVVGKFKYTLVEKDSLGTIISSEPLPLNIEDRSSLNILILNKFPIFETKYLKNYLAEIGHEVTVRSQITTNKYKFEYFNTEKKPFFSFSDDQLDKYDLLFIDSESYVGLSRKNLSTIHRSIRNSGLGLFIQPDAILFTLAPERTSFSFLPSQRDKSGLEFLPNKELDKYPYEFKMGYGLEKIHHFNNNTITAYRRMESGRVGTTLIQNTYQLLLEGHKEAYEQFWSEIISALAKRKYLQTEWINNSGFAYQDQPFHPTIRTSIINPVILNSEEIEIPIQRDVHIESKWYATTYPTKIGWSQLHVNNDSLSTYDYYVMDTLNWKSLNAFNTRKENQRHFSGSMENQKKVKFLQPINRFWFFLIFVVGMGYLWLEPKLFSK
ncbi:hypothetical protein [Sediminicola sp. YIK13]|uniref:hypothetical protein n=1 Tax=Sediminicola sp. YIK13 TaxID=1453352 RepID=UPI0011A9C616|nr:hypothetical protein [Sediminicola sp. YIK13]